MPYLAGLITGVLLTVLVAFVADNLAAASAPSDAQAQRIVNWDVAAEKLHSSMEALRQGALEVREDLHEATG
jgi:hypothetical protein